MMCKGDFKTKSLLPLHIKMSSESLMGPLPMYASDDVLSALNKPEQKIEKEREEKRIKTAKRTSKMKKAVFRPGSNKSTSATKRLN